MVSENNKVKYTSHSTFGTLCITGEFLVLANFPPLSSLFAPVVSIRGSERVQLHRGESAQCLAVDIAVTTDTAIKMQI